MRSVPHNEARIVISLVLIASPVAATSKQLLLIRHGVTNMNEYLSRVPYGERGFVDPGDFDTALTERGREMAAALEPALTAANAASNIELIVSSPLSRALDTASLATAGLSAAIPRIVNADIAERRYLSSDVGGSPAVLSAAFPPFAPSLEALPAQWWWEDQSAQAVAAARDKRLRLQGSSELTGVALPVEPAAAFLTRLERFRSWLNARTERKIVVVAHWGVFFSCLGRSLQNCELVECTMDDLLPSLMPPPD